MLISLSWLSKYVRIPDDTEAFVREVTMTGLHVEQLLERGLADPNVVVGRVIEAARHPNADKLSLCKVEVGRGDAREIVCGAPNVAAGQLVLVALPGAKLPNGVKIRSTKIRGAKSDGMICSEIELGLGSDAAGIMVLAGDHEPGTPVGEALLPPDRVIEIEVTPNRPDLLAHVGVAREVAAVYKTPVELPYDTSQVIETVKRSDFRVEIEDASDCTRYVGKRVSGVRVGPSPAWLVSALESVGLGSVNNVVDAGNYVMMELGQPVHAFDYTRLAGGHIMTRRARGGERIEALDGRAYDLDPGVLVIADDRGPVAIAGVIGGEESAVHDDTTEILVESAHFEPTLVRRGRKALAISTDAAYRFERGTDRDICLIAAQRAAQLILEVAGGSSGDAIDVYPSPRKPQRLAIRASATRRILGSNISIADIESLLERLGFVTVKRADEAVTVEVPSYRLDIKEEIDLIEEVGRLYGYDRIGSGWGFRSTAYATRLPLDKFTDTLADHLAARGLSEVITSSFTDGRELNDFAWQAGDRRQTPLPVRNPLNANHHLLRTSLLPSMFDVVRRNIDYGVRHIGIYQIGRVFLATKGEQKLPEEKTMLGLVVTRPEGQDFWYNSKTSVDLFDLKREIEVLLDTFKVDLGSDLCYDFDGSTGQFSYARSKDVFIEGGILPEPVSLRYDFDQPVWYATVDLVRLHTLGVKRPKPKSLADYPASKRDLSLVARDGTEYKAIEKSLVKSGGRLLESVHVFDVYRGEHLENGLTAYGVRLNFRSPERTLTDGEIDQIIDKILTKLKNDLGVELRS